MQVPVLWTAQKVIQFAIEWDVTESLPCKSLRTQYFLYPNPIIREMFLCTETFKKTISYLR